MYRGKKRHEMPPHIYAISESAYRCMLQGNWEWQSEKYSEFLRFYLMFLNVPCSLQKILIPFLKILFLLLQKNYESFRLGQTVWPYSVRSWKVCLFFVSILHVNLHIKKKSNFYIYIPFPPQASVAATVTSGLLRGGTRSQTQELTLARQHCATKPSPWPKDQGLKPAEKDQGMELGGRAFAQRRRRPGSILRAAQSKSSRRITGILHWAKKSQCDL